jgi:hypothetical protein
MTVTSAVKGQTVSDREVIVWASRFWPDVRETWWQYRYYYRREYERAHPVR